MKIHKQLKHIGKDVQLNETRNLFRMNFHSSSDAGKISSEKNTPIVN